MKHEVVQLVWTGDRMDLLIEEVPTWRLVARSAGDVIASAIWYGNEDEYPSAWRDRALTLLRPLFWLGGSGPSMDCVRLDQEWASRHPAQRAFGDPANEDLGFIDPSLVRAIAGAERIDAGVTAETSLTTVFLG